MVKNLSWYGRITHANCIRQQVGLFVQRYGCSGWHGRLIKFLLILGHLNFGDAGVGSSKQIRWSLEKKLFLRFGPNLGPIFAYKLEVEILEMQGLIFCSFTSHLKAWNSSSSFISSRSLRKKVKTRSTEMIGCWLWLSRCR